MLKYTEYKEQQALWLQREDKKRSNQGTNTEQFCIQCYIDYLDLIGFNDVDKLSKMQGLINSIGTYHLCAGEFYNMGYDKEIADNINELMDNLH